MKRKLKIEVAKHIIELNIDQGYEVLLEKDYGLFFSDGKPEFSIDVELSADLLVADGTEGRLVLQDSLITIVDDYLISSLDLRTKSGQVKINPAMFLHSLGVFLRNICTLLVVLEDRGIALHAVGILKDEEAHIFVGPSTAGKTTVANLSRDKIVLSDDLVMIKKVDGEFMVFPTPHWGDKQVGPRENRPYRINSIFKLIKDKQVYLEKFSPAQAAADIFTIPHIPYEYIQQGQLLDTFFELISVVPYYGMHFLPEPSFWDCIVGIKSMEFSNKGD